MKKLYKTLIPVLFLTAASCNSATGQTQNGQNQQAEPSTISSGQTAEAVFAGGCFWCVEADFEKLPGVIEAISGYGGGHKKNPTYQEVVRETTGHYEVAKIIYDPTQLSYEQLLEHFWTSVDPTDGGGQFCDRGNSYRTAIFATEEQFDQAKASKQELQNSNRLTNPVVTPVLQAGVFYRAEEYHQDYYKKNPGHYNRYRTGCRRDARLKAIWGG